MKCPRCLNEDPAFFYRGSRGWYCRKCISFSRILLEEDQEPVSLSPPALRSEEYLLRYPLTPKQKQVAEEAARRIWHQDVLIHAVCGAGKTELTILAIHEHLKRGKKVCFAIARRQVVLELQQRLAQIFPRARVIAVCGGHTQVLDGDLIVCTTHQLWRYYMAFDLLILDEPDAYPYVNNAVLQGVSRTSCRGRFLYLTATPDAELLRQVEQGTMCCLKLSRRPHGHPLPVPVLRIVPFPLDLLVLLRWLYAHRSHPCLVFVPTIRMAEGLGRLLRLYRPCAIVTSRTVDKDTQIQAFREGRTALMCATTVMERGVTIPDVQICVYHAEHPVFHEAGLVQMAGRAGRTFAHPEGDVLFLLQEKSPAAEKCQKELTEANACAV